MGPEYLVTGGLIIMSLGVPDMLPAILLVVYSTLQNNN
jgi:hypothetical protein